MTTKKRKTLSLEDKVADLVERLQQAMRDAIEEEVDPHDAPVYLAGKRDVYAGNVLIVLEDLGVKVKVPK